MKCPHCGCTRFVEKQIVSESVDCWWNEEEQRIEYGQSSFNFVDHVEDVKCEECLESLGGDFFTCNEACEGDNPPAEEPA
jgi:hypothetical protein